MVDDLDKRLERIEEQLARVTKLLDECAGRRLDLEERIEERLGAIAADASKMARHVGFVESVYDRVKRPFFFLMGAIDRATIQSDERCRGLADGDWNESAPKTTRPSTSISS